MMRTIFIRQYTYNKLTKETDACRAVRMPRTMNLPVQYYVRHIYQVKRKIDFSLLCLCARGFELPTTNDG